MTDSAVQHILVKNEPGETGGNDPALTLLCLVDRNIGFEVSY